MAELSTEAKAVCGAFWGPMLTEKLTFQRPHILTQKARKGLDELTEAGFLTVEDEPGGGLTWRPTDKMRSERPRVSMAFARANKFPITTE